MDHSQNSSVYFLETKRTKSYLLCASTLIKIGEIIKSLERRDGDYYYIFIETIPGFTSWCIGISSEINKLEAQEKRMSKFRKKRLYIKFFDLIPPLANEPVKISVSPMVSSESGGVWGDDDDDFAGIILNEPWETCLLVNPKIKNGERILRDVLHRI